MRPGQHEVPLVRDQSLLRLRIRAPKDEDHGFFSLVQQLDDSVCENLPALAAVRSCLVLTHSKTGIQKQYALLRPGDQTAVVLRRRQDPEVIMKLLEDIHQRRRLLHALLHRKSESVCLSLFMIGILAQDHRFHILIRRQFQRIKNIVHIRINDPVSVLPDQELPKLLIILFVKFSRQDPVPVIPYIYHTFIIQEGFGYRKAGCEKTVETPGGKGYDEDRQEV